MAGGVGTGLFIGARCLVCNFDIPGREIDFEKIPTDKDISKAKEEIQKDHADQGCSAKPVFFIFRGIPIRYSLQAGYPLPDSAKALLIDPIK